MTLYRDEGVVLRTMRLGEADRIVTIVCRHHGKVRAVAKGVRRTSSKFGGRTEPLTHVSLLCWQGRELDIVNQVEVIENFRSVREDLARTTMALAMVEVADQVAVERHANARLYEILVGALRCLERGDGELVPASFFLKVLAAEGSAPILEACAACGSDDDELVAFDLTEGGALCRRCRRGRPLSAGALALVRRILGGDLASVLAEPPGRFDAEVSTLATEAIEVHLDRRLRSVRATQAL